LADSIAIAALAARAIIPNINFFILFFLSFGASDFHTLCFGHSPKSKL
jgi:hypothetical protein